jgi:rod shape-determining protein MreC
MTVPEMLVRYTRPVAILAILAASLVAVTRRENTAVIRRAVTDGVTLAASPVRRVLGWAGKPVPALVFRDKEGLRKDIEQLRRRNRELEYAVAVRNEELEAENRRLRRLLDFRRSVQFDTVPARVIGRDYSYLTIDRGADAGIREQMCAMTVEGVVGRVLSVSGHTSKILLMWDSNNRLGGIVQRSRAQGIVEGDQESRFIMKYIEATSDVRSGDLIVTSGEGGVFPKGLAVGTVDAVTRRGGELFQTAAVRPAADLDRLEEVLVAVGKPLGPPEVGTPPPAVEPTAAEPAAAE